MDSAKKPFYKKRKEKIDKTKPPMTSMDSAKKTSQPSHQTLTRAPISFSSSSSSLSSSFKFAPYTSEAMESLLAELFASASSIKAAYAQLQLAQSPYDPTSIQSADLEVITELRHVSDLKRAFLNRSLQLSSPLQSQIHEQQNLLKTYEITSKKLQSDIDQKDSELISLRSELSHQNLKCRELEMKAYPGKTLASLDGLHLSGLNPIHFLCALRFAVKSIRNFSRLMVERMKISGWDLDDAAKAIHTGTALKNTAHRSFYFESYVCNIMFSDFHKKDFNLELLQDRERWERSKFFDEFIALKSLNIKELLQRSEEKFTNGFKVFLSAKYLSMVQPKMELSFFRDLHQRNRIKSCHEFPNSDWFMGFAEMARRVWMLHCIFFSFGLETKVSIFQLRRGTRFSEVYMENVVAEESAAGAGKVPAYRDKVVGFTVVPGFQIGMTLIQARVYLSGID